MGKRKGEVSQKINKLIKVVVFRTCFEGLLIIKSILIGSRGNYSLEIEDSYD